MARQKKSVMEKLGLEKVRKCTAKICRERSKFLQKKIDQGKFEGKLLYYARYYRSWYGWLSKNGGTRAEKKNGRKKAA